ncbi:MAG TPA: hypothetical protein PKJ07_05460 [Bacteroidales bacterium]|jgi:hypothetical protein|nr:hypothetical protein [Bacteroidales bacterium]MDI3545882.1 hypothetical protein [Rikenellaceae bacterium]MDN5355961.1 hypothetical protein [Rikenellaceae bacterium]HOB27568.1 hypothetical protein [Bacteroidales bacterium]HOJ24510.1 hypothetical protein [Bacteroidales bacterium]
MKKLAILVFVAMIAVSFSSCQKEDTQTAIINNVKEIGFKGVLQSCLYRIEGNCVYGVCCTPGAFEQCPCCFPCTPIIIEGSYITLDCANILEKFGFTVDEISIWQNDKNALECSDTFILNHYNFYLLLYEQGLSKHPDEMLKNMKK